MFRQVFNKIFGSGESNNRLHLSDSPAHNRAPIYAIPTASPYFQSVTDSNFDLNVNNPGQQSSQPAKKNFKNSQPIPKFTESNTRQIYIAPYCIRYSNSTLDDTIYRIDDDSLNEIATEILESDNLPPKLQIVFYDGKYYAINNSHLQIYKQLQMSGLITHVQADVISLEAIPLALRKHLLQPICLNNSISNSNDTVSDEEFDYAPDEIGVANSSSSALSSSNGIVDILSADILTPASIEMISKQMMVDETYEFGTCENCIDSDDDESKKSIQEETEFEEDKTKDDKDDYGKS
ncbi:hypothetical protein BpHYR1_041839 [Brachionus plicatilis]|uniref:Uncharacterized protein n=1 Tax=Brachionus plicatilis TaxID=10195 RepID=A0A3M7QBE4_BRAPC|nr:hypothetical protein BpHYR1_041839 [Brachionus plicatilis]